MTSKEARKNLGETYKTLDKDHTLEVLKLIWEKEDEEREDDPFAEYHGQFADYYGSD